MSDRYDLVIVGMGSGGSIAADLASRLDLRVAVVERGRLGGDCLWTGCVPSKALIAAAKAAHHMRTADRFGITSVEPDVDLTAVWKRIHAVQDEIAAADDNADRYTAMGLEVIFGDARLASPTTVVVGDRTLETRYILLSTGSRPAAPAIPGLADAGYLTSDTVFALETPPASFVNIGGGPIAVEMVQAFTRLGIPTTLLQDMPRILEREDPALVDALVGSLRDEGVDLHFDVNTERVAVEGNKKVVYGTEAGKPARWEADELLIGVGRVPNTEGLGLAELGIGTTRRGIEVDDRGRTRVHTVYACGDVAGRYLFTHSAAYEAIRAVRDMFFPGAGKVTAGVPWCTFTDPALAHAGVTEAEAREAHGSGVEVWRRDLADNDRARADGTTVGSIVIVTHKRRVIGAHILAPAAGEMIHELALAIDRGVKIDKLANLVHVYPTVATGIGQTAGDAALARVSKLAWLARRGRVGAKNQ